MRQPASCPNQATICRPDGRPRGRDPLNQGLRGSAGADKKAVADAQSGPISRACFAVLVSSINFSKINWLARNRGVPRNFLLARNESLTALRTQSNCGHSATPTRFVSWRFGHKLGRKPLTLCFHSLPAFKPCAKPSHTVGRAQSAVAPNTSRPQKNCVSEESR